MHINKASTSKSQYTVSGREVPCIVGESYEKIIEIRESPASVSDAISEARSFLGNLQIWGVGCFDCKYCESITDGNYETKLICMRKVYGYKKGRYCDVNDGQVVYDSNHSGPRVSPFYVVGCRSILLDIVEIPADSYDKFQLF